MKNIYLLIIAFVMIVGAGYFFQLRSNNDKTPYKIIAYVAAVLMKELVFVFVVDVRTPEEYQQGHIENAKLLPLSELEEKASAVIPDKSKKILLYCRSGRRSAVAAELLVNSGYEKVYDFGGINDWKGKLVRE